MSQSYYTLPEIDPAIFNLGFLSPKWYGMMYLVGFVAAWWLANRRLARTGWSKEQLSDMLFWGFLGVIIGGRVGYVMFYQFALFIDNPLYLFKINEGGMSFHGGLLGVLTALWLSARRLKVPFLVVGDFIAPLVPIGLGAGRIGNFINSELWGRTTDVPWAIIFPNAGSEPRHPSQLYEFALEGVLLFIILWLYSKKPRPIGAVSGIFLLGYGCFRFFVEFFRQWDGHLDLYLGFLSRGQMLSLPMIIAGVLMIVWAYKQNKIYQPQSTNQKKGKKV
ncbi:MULTISPECIES: prolipoprotein diacylglyceryl transferase [Alteromonadaceae]|uniref:prolipoprotein diacylglyceryl transferase n=1 Tax=Alteromonadaceae TaxID=72275 RepID=UPI001C088A48|nr:MULTISPECIES: prolipoprotein diacylglyceryl transferase [Aliiglaciecola]MBU2878754.1 prolipoprotein diacylglyceryl transferase [Aliiglaciecola lipolytica]MDO6711348.1 prolipoprotein diacylglyceryl transferase [Aliiglaciecola sp. 2_MG-2023]MDO6752203.1 prolipoprotein diacylglyceryl transferase [Aliiglaciecola sp. 1_MG-2023]